MGEFNSGSKEDSEGAWRVTQSGLALGSVTGAESAVFPRVFGRFGLFSDLAGWTGADPPSG